MFNRMITQEVIEGAANASSLSISFKTLTLTGGTPDEATLIAIDGLSPRNFIRLKRVLADLESMGHLNKETLTLAIQRVTLKMPATPESKVSKHKQASRKEIRLNDQHAAFLNKGASRKVDGSGGQGIVNKGYLSADAVDPSVSVKRFNHSDDNYSLPKATLAKRESRYLNLFERHAQWYNSKKGPVIISDWQNGQDIGDFTEANFDFSSISIARRMKWLVSGLTDLNKLHAHFRVHADIKPGNFVLDSANDQMHLIDFGSAQKVNCDKEFAATAMYIDMQEGKPRKTGSDMFSMGYVVAIFFPELFTIKMKGMPVLETSPSEDHVRIALRVEPPYIISKNKTSGLSNSEKAVITLLDAMMEAIAENRCTSQQALSFCSSLSALLNIKADIDDQDLSMLLNSTINRNVYEVEDALRGCKRAAKFGAEKVKPATMFTPPAQEQKADPKKDDQEEKIGCVIC